MRSAEAQAWQQAEVALEAAKAERRSRRRRETNGKDSFTDDGIYVYISVYIYTYTALQLR